MSVWCWNDIRVLFWHMNFGKSFCWRETRIDAALNIFGKRLNEGKNIIKTTIAVNTNQKEDEAQFLFQNGRQGGEIRMIP